MSKKVFITMTGRSSSRTEEQSAGYEYSTKRTCYSGTSPRFWTSKEDSCVTGSNRQPPFFLEVGFWSGTVLNASGWSGVQTGELWASTKVASLRFRSVERWDRRSTSQISDQGLF